LRFSQINVTFDTQSFISAAVIKKRGVKKEIPVLNDVHFFRFGYFPRVLFYIYFLLF